MRRYSELVLLPTLKERFEYLRLDGKVADETFGFDRWINQNFYRSPEWKRIRDQIIVRDMGCELAIPDYTIFGKIYIHHMNPIRKEDIVRMSSLVLDPEYLICCSYDMHNAIHYGNEEMLPTDPVVRRPNDTCPWR